MGTGETLSCEVSISYQLSRLRNKIWFKKKVQKTVSQLQNQVQEMPTGRTLKSSLTEQFHPTGLASGIRHECVLQFS